MKTEPGSVPYSSSAQHAGPGHSTQVASMQESYEEEGFDYGEYEGGDEHGSEGQYQDIGATDQNTGNIFTVNMFSLDRVF